VSKDVKIHGYFLKPRGGLQAKKKFGNCCSRRW